MSTMRLLWLDDNLAQIEVLAEALRAKGHEVKVVTTLEEAESLLGTHTYHLLILDVMVPTWSAEEEERYSPEATERGLKTGLIFYRRAQEMLRQKGTAVLVLTIRRERELLEAFMEAGLPEHCFATKFALRNPERFVEKVENILGETVR